MANTIISPNMNLPVPVVGTDPGPDWANNVNACLSAIDSHNHTAGQGVPITPQAINVNANLPMNNNNLTSARSIRFQPQAVPVTGASDLGALYELGVDLFYIDGAGNQIRITQGGSVTGATGTITGLPSGTASAAFAGSTFTFQSATNTPANMHFGPVSIGQPVAGGNSVTISPSVAQAANYSLTLPVALPPTQSAFVADASGNESFVALSTMTYTPTFSNATGGTGFGVNGPMMVTRVGNMVHVSGQVSFSSTAYVTTWFMTLPIPRIDGNFTGNYQASGNTTKASGVPSAEAGNVGAVAGDILVGANIVSTVAFTTNVAYMSFDYSLTNF